MHEEDEDRDCDVMECQPRPEMTYEMSLQHAISVAIENAAIEEVMEHRRLVNADPEGEGWAFLAAESMMSERDYTHVETWKVIDHLEAKVRDMPLDALVILDKLVNPITLPL